MMRANRPTHVHLHDRIAKLEEHRSKSKVALDVLKKENDDLTGAVQEANLRYADLMDKYIRLSQAHMAVLDKVDSSATTFPSINTQEGEAG